MDTHPHVGDRQNPLMNRIDEHEGDILRRGSYRSMALFEPNNSHGLSGASASSVTFQRLLWVDSGQSRLAAIDP